MASLIFYATLVALALDLVVLIGGAVALTLVALLSDLTAVLMPKLWLVLSFVMLNMA